MEVVKENFYQLLPQIEQAINESTFIAINMECTGVHNGTTNSPFDTASQIYQKLRRSCKDFLMYQVGLCIVKYDTEKKKFTYRAYNFNVYPKPLRPNEQPREFYYRPFILQCLSNSQFDLDKLIKHGIPFINALDEQELHNEIFNRYKQTCLLAQASSKPTNIIPVPDHYKTYVENACEKVKFLLKSEICSEVIIADNINPFICQLVQQEVYKEYSYNKVCLQSKIFAGIGHVIVAYKAIPIEIKAKVIMECEETELEKEIGISVIFKKIRNSNKPVVGHNMTVDIGFIIHQFCYPLPPEYKEFQDILPMISHRALDTKYISSTEPLNGFFESTILSNLYISLTEKNIFRPFTTIEPEGREFGYTNGMANYFDSGYNAYLTGSVFINLCNLYAKVNDIQELILPDSDHLNQYENKLFMFRYDEDPCLNLNGPEPTLQRNHVYYIAFPIGWKSTDILNVFKPYSDLYISYINNVSAWVALKDASQANLINSILPKIQAFYKNVVLIPWSEYYNVDNNTTTSMRMINNESSLSPPKDK